MARYSRIEVAVRMRETGIIPVFYNKDSGICRNVIKACYEGGIRVFEFTNRGDYAHELFSELNKWAEKNYPDLIMGVGSVTDSGTSSLYIQLGANFIVSPILNPDMAKVCNRRKILWCPGCASLSEISYAEELGAEIVKIFPGSSVGGPAFVKAVKGPCPWTSIMPTGGVEPTMDNLKEWFSSGVTCVGIGSKLISGEMIQKEEWGLLTTKVGEAVNIVRSLRNK
ncbi:MAG: bifunctional 4-hydroxy-2-oxoglutarate aldolase/2-dehydro-3-deoxy-phosphogluconate aldolase [Bacteroidetes bacterium]|jgi:2-dehydro-3-deoxyphosphogluconate aldolase/(4S)-4-hydroxy-2-oxoglutarate aldolase|nr:bifunctional 4-hydroxy-2-oxoglutarate aldolase/2-dehydro-3-deoxy-phosphogluconate aldolase [Bacteroidota bacterium]